MSNNPNQTRTWLFCLQQVFELILLCHVQSLFTTRTPTRRECGSGSRHFKPSMALGLGLDIAELLRMLSPPRSGDGSCQSCRPFESKSFSCCIASSWWELLPAFSNPQWDLTLKSSGALSQQRVWMERAGCTWGSARAVACSWAAASKLPGQQTSRLGGHPHGPGG